MSTISSRSPIIDPMGSFQLAPKYARMLAIGRLTTIRLDFHHGGIIVQGQVPTVPGEPERWESLPDAIAATAAEVEDRPWAAEKEYLLNKFETRLDMEAPLGLRNAVDITAFNAAMAALPFEQRKVFKMSNKDYGREYVRFINGVGERRPLDAIVSMETAERLERSTTTRGRGRGGRGRGSAFQAPQAQA